MTKRQTELLGILNEKGFTVKEAKKLILEIEKQQNENEKYDLNYETEWLLERRIFQLLKKIGVRPALKGYKFLKEGIKLTYVDETYLMSITKRLYPDIAKRFNANAKAIERSIRYAIESINMKSDFNKELFGNFAVNEKPYISTTIATVVEHLKNS